MTKARAKSRQGDPIVDELAVMIHQSKLSDEAIADRVGAARHAKMSPSTVAALRKRTTHRPTNYTIDWIGHALGYARRWTKLGD